MLYTIQSIGTLCQSFHQSNKKIVLATGFFDLLHQEHFNFLQKAKAVGDILVVAVESDERARIIKGEGRPIEPQSIRCQHLLALMPSSSDLSNRSELTHPLVDYVIALAPDFDNPTAYASLMSTVKPNIYAVSSHTSHLENKRSLTEKYGGQLVVVHEHNPTISTSLILGSHRKKL